MYKKTLSFTPIGGLNEMGKNQMLVEIDNESFLIDNGFKHPCQNTPGVDFYVGRAKDLYKNPPMFVLITHGHLDHVGGIPVLLEDFPDIKIICTEFTKRIILNLVDQHKKDSHPNFQIIEVGDTIDFENFKIKTFKMDHSVIESLGFFCETNYGTFIHTGDFRINLKDLYKSTDFKTLQEYGKSGVLCMFSDSTNAFREGGTESEESVIEQIELVINSKKNGKFIIATFSTQVERIKGIVNLSRKLRKKILIDGRSMKNIFSMCQEMQIFDDVDDVLVDVEEAKNVVPNDLIILTTGTQGEVRSGLALISTDRHKLIKVNKEDVVLMSSSFIPGNEESINELINSFSEKEVEVITYKDFLIHVSGHGYKEELKKAIEVINPKYFVPIHGEAYSMYHHKNIAIELGIPKSNIFLLKNGDKLSIDKKKIAAVQRNFLDIEIIYKDGNFFSTLTESFLESRQKMKKNGIILIFLTVATYTEVSVKFFKIKSVGALNNIIDYRGVILKKIIDTIGGNRDRNVKVLENKISNSVESYIFYVARKSPVVVTSIVLEKPKSGLAFSRMDNRSSLDS